MDKLSEHAIRMLEIVDGENDFFRNDDKRQADIARAVYDVILQVQMLKMADRKTENSSKKPNNAFDKDINVRSKDCETCRHWEHGAYSHYYCARLEMRQECKYKPKTDCETCKYKDHNWWSSKCDPCCRGNSNYEPTTEPQNEFDDKPYLYWDIDGYLDEVDEP